MPAVITPTQFPSHIYGLHDIGGQDLIANAGRTGWLLDSIDLRSQTGADYSRFAQAGFGVIVRLNNGYGPAGTLPPSFEYDAFAARCAAFAQNSPGAHVWLIGNEMNTNAERPELPDGWREIITPQKYAECFSKCRRAIRSIPDHANDWLIPGAVGPYNAESGDWVQYLLEILNRLGHQVDGIALHCYTHDFDVDQISSDDMMGAPFNNRHFNFRAYRDFLNALPAACRSLPVFITETNPFAGWKDSNIGWIQAAYHEINAWNADAAHQPIQALILFRWQTLDDQPEWGLQNKRALIADFQAALAAGYRARWLSPLPTPSPPSPAPSPGQPEYLVEWSEMIDVPGKSMIANSTLTGPIFAKNKGSRIWLARGANPVRLGYRWYNEQGFEMRVAPYAGNFSLTRNVPPGGTATFNTIELRAPKTPGTYTLRWDMVHEGITWFGARGSPTADLEIQVTAEPPPPPPLPQWVVSFLSHDTPVSERAGQTVMVNLRLRNTGASVWSQRGSNPVHVGYKWFNEAGQQQLDVEDRRTALPHDVLPGQQVALGAILATPKTPGNYSLRWDLVAEGITWFADATSPPLVVPVTITTVSVDISGWRAEASANSIQIASALDGDPRTFWDSGTAQAPGQWFRLNLSTPRMIDGIQFLSPGMGFPASYALRVSADGAAWSGMARIESGNLHDVVAVFAPQLIQYVQIDLLAPLSVSWMISEILVHSATPWTARASHNADTANQAIDNQPNTAWSTGEPQTPGMWFQIDLGRIETVSGIMLDAPPDESPVGLRIATWNAAASRWQIAQEVTNNRGAMEISFAATSTQFVNLQLLAPCDQPWTILHARVVRVMETWLRPKAR